MPQVCVALLASCLSAPTRAAAPWEPPKIARPVFLYSEDPKFELPTLKVVVDEKPVALWLRALQRPDTELQRLTIDTLVIAHRRGVPGVERAVPQLVPLLRDPDTNPQVARAALAALAAFDCQDQAELLTEIARRDTSTVSDLAETILIGWQSPRLTADWQQRLRDPSCGSRLLELAIKGVGAVRHQEASEPLRQLVLRSAMPSRVRLTAARALGSIHSAGLHATAGLLAEQSDVSSPLLAIALLSQHDDSDSITILKQLARHENSAVVAAALHRLFEIDPLLVDEVSVEHVESRDVNVRRWAARGMIAAATSNRMEPLASLLNDVNPGLRRGVAGSLVELAKQESLRDEIIQRSVAVLNRDDWRGCEQAALVLVNLDHKPAGGRLVELLDHSRDEVMVTAAWGLRRLQLDEHLPAMLDHSKSLFRRFRAGELGESDLGPIDKQAHLFTAFGNQRHREADELLKSYVPKNFALGDEARAAAAWALGYLHEAAAPEDLTRQMVERINDIASLEPERDLIRYCCLIALGRLKAEAALPTLRENARPGFGALGMASSWSLNQITGEPLITLPVPTVEYDDYFLKPLDEDQP